MSRTPRRPCLDGQSAAAFFLLLLGEFLILNIILKSTNDDPVSTGMENIEGYGDEPIKFIHQDKMYILYHGKIYDATGKFVKEINK